jgi:ACT domain-containing protein
MSQGKPVKKLSDIKLTVLAALEAAFNNDYSIVQACQYAGITRQTYYNWLENIEDFTEKMEIAKQMPLRKAREVIIKAVNEGDTNLAFKFLQVRDNAYKNKTAIEIDPKTKTLEDKIKDFLNDPANKPENLPDDSEEVALVN